VMGVCAALLLVLGMHVPRALSRLLHVAMGVLQ